MKLRISESNKSFRYSICRLKVNGRITCVTIQFEWFTGCLHCDNIIANNKPNGEKPVWMWKYSREWALFVFSAYEIDYWLFKLFCVFLSPHTHIPRTEYDTHNDSDYWSWFFRYWAWCGTNNDIKLMKYCNKTFRFLFKVIYMLVMWLKLGHCRWLCHPFEHIDNHPSQQLYFCFEW